MWYYNSPLGLEPFVATGVLCFTQIFIPKITSVSLTSCQIYMLLCKSFFLRPRSMKSQHGSQMMGTIDDRISMVLRNV